MKVVLFSTLSLMVLAVSNEAVAADPCGTQFAKRDSAQISRLLSNNTVCTSDSQEQHLSNGELWDYKKGPSDLIDPTSKVGTWSVSNDQVQYNYGDVAYKNDVYTDNLGSKPNVCFYNGTTAVSGTIINGIKGCQ